FRTRAWQRRTRARRILLDRIEKSQSAGHRRSGSLVRRISLRGGEVLSGLRLVCNYWYDRSVDCCRVISQLDVEHLPFRRWNAESGFDETVWHCDRICEVGIGADGIDKEQLVAAQGALAFEDSLLIRYGVSILVDSFVVRRGPFRGRF